MLLTVAVVAFLSALTTLFSGFGLGTLLLPAFALFFPLEVAVAATAVVHLANNLWKSLLLGRHADWRVWLVFGLPAAGAAFLGALVLHTLSNTRPLLRYELFGSHEVTPLGLSMGLLILCFAVFELHPKARRLSFPRSWLAVGGLLSGFLGGLSGHQGALRSAFLIRLELSREAFIATGVVIAITIDCVRILTYGVAGLAGQLTGTEGLGRMVLVGILAAFAGSYLGRRLMTKVTMRSIQTLVGVMLVLVGLGIAAGLI